MRALARRWLRSPWIMVVAGYVVPPVGLYLMWRYRSWPAWVKSAFTIAGLALWPLGTYLSSVYLMPRIF